LGDVAAESLAIVQYTSGSTSSPKGVTLTHSNVLAGVDAIVHAMSLTHRDIHASWLPLFHDMGLCGLLSGLRAGTAQYLTSPAAFVKDPAAWLEQFARRRASIYASPSFAYRLLLDRVNEDALKTLDLSSWRVAFNGGEPVDAACMSEFIARFSVAGFRPAAMVPCYGMAEATLAVTFDSFEQMPSFESVARDALGSERLARGVSEDAQGSRRVVNVGRPVSGMRVRIADESGCPCAERVVGEIEICGASVTSGYYKNPEETRDRIRDGWLKTGDLGYFAAECLYVTGRSKQMLIVRGTNYYPEDVEEAVRETQGIYHRRCVAVSADATGEVLVLAERSSTAGPELAVEIRRAAEVSFPELTFSVSLVRPRSLPQTSSGKFQRLLALELHRSGQLSEHPASPPVHGESQESAGDAVA
jgi:acyl-CoA synthetase (AMP-forming)/AMP-acid ligase II